MILYKREKSVKYEGTPPIWRGPKTSNLWRSVADKSTNTLDRNGTNDNRAIRSSVTDMAKVNDVCLF